MTDTIKVLIIGCGHMGSSHARAYQKMEGVRVAGLVSRGPDSRVRLAKELGVDLPRFGDAETALKATRPDAVSISTYPDTHAPLAIMALEAGAHVFVEKPIAETAADARKVTALARRTGKKVVVL